MSISVIIPNYNNERFLNKCLESVLSQSIVVDEIIVVDDCSKDASRDIIKDFALKDPNVKPIFLEKNGGVSHARNVGISAATSEYVTTLDADDFYYESTKLEKEMDVISHHPYKSVVAYSKIVYCDENDNIIRKLDYPKNEYFQGDILLPLLSESITKTLMRDCVFSKELAIKSGLYNEKMCLFEDYDFLIRLAKNAEFYCTFDYGTAYRQKNFGLSQRSYEEIRSTKEAIMSEYYSDLTAEQQKKVNKMKSMKNVRRFKNKINEILYNMR